MIIKPEINESEYPLNYGDDSPIEFTDYDDDYFESTEGRGEEK